MKYHRLSQDQLNSVYKQFILFLSSKGIDKECWDFIKKENNDKISLLLDESPETMIFSLLLGIPLINFFNNMLISKLFIIYG